MQMTSSLSSSPSMKPASRSLYISDIHMAGLARYDDRSAWFDPDHHTEKLFSFLERKLIQDPPEQLVLLGDIFENWLAPVEAKPCTWDEILGANQNFIDLIARFIDQGIDVLFTPGNHDLHLTLEDLERFLPGIRYTREQHIPGVLHAEHGHELTFFNSRHLDPLGTHPPGYFFARLGKERLPGGHSIRSVLQYMSSGALRRFPNANCLGHIMRTIFRIARLGDEDRFIMEDDSISVRDVVARYEMAVSEMSLGERAWRLLQRPTNLAGIAWRLSRDVPLVLLGHSHHARLLQTKHGIYANPGAWCQPVCHAIEVDHDSSRHALDVRLLRVSEDGSETVVKRARSKTLQR